MDATLLALISYYSSIYGMDAKVVKAMVEVESRGNQYATGQLGEQGLLQIRPEFIKEPGINLYDAEDNISIGVKMLVKKKKRCPHSEGLTWVICWNRGVTGASKVEDPYSDQYYQKVMMAYQEMK